MILVAAILDVFDVITAAQARIDLGSRSRSVRVTGETLSSKLPPVNLHF